MTTRTALLSVCDKNGVVEFARELVALGFNILASRGTAKALEAGGVPVTDVASIVGEPILGHRVVTLSREIHAALLATDSPEDTAELERIGVPRIDLVYVNMYSLEEEIDKLDCTLASVLNKTDIGGPTMLRSAGKGRRIVMCKPEQIPAVLHTIHEFRFMDGGEVSPSFISGLVAEAEAEVAEHCAYSSVFHSMYCQNASGE